MDLKQLCEIIPFKWRVQSSFKGQNGIKCKMVAYIDSRAVQVKLDEVCGADSWQDKYYSVKDTLFCSIGILIDGQWVWKTDAGTPSKTEKEKGEASDAFKRAAVKWGINRDSYNVGIVTLDGREYNGKKYPCSPEGKFLKGQALNDYCNSIAKIEEMDNYLVEPSKITEDTLS